MAVEKYLKAALPLENQLHPFSFLKSIQICPWEVKLFSLFLTKYNLVFKSFNNIGINEAFLFRISLFPIVLLKSLRLALSARGVYLCQVLQSQMKSKEPGIIVNVVRPQKTTSFSFPKNIIIFPREEILIYIVWLNFIEFNQCGLG